jgi:hypothetical protein
MAVPKKKKSISKVKLRYTTSHKKSFINRTLSYKILDIIRLYGKKENYMGSYNMLYYSWRATIQNRL